MEKNIKYFFYSSQLMTDNCYALFKTMINLGVKGKYVWLYNSQEELVGAKKKVEKMDVGSNQNIIYVQKKHKIESLFHYYTSNFIFYSHGFLEQLPKFFWQKKINLWHGMPLKKIGLLKNGKKATFNFDYTIVNSPVFEDGLKEAFSISDSMLIKVGAPRNDFLMESKTMLDSSLRKMFKNSKNSLVIWMPTFRNSMDEDNQENQEKIAGILPLSKLKSFDDFLIKQGVNLLIKIHPLDIINLKELSDYNHSLSCLKFIDKNLTLSNSKYDFYEMLKDTDALITDYSSIYFDYLLMNKPIALTIVDKKSYEKTRGCYEKVSNSIKNNEITDMNQLKNFIENLNKDSNMNNIQKDIFQTYNKKSGNSKFILKELNLIN